MNQNKISLAKKTLQYLEKKKLRDINLKNFLSNTKVPNMNNKIDLILNINDFFDFQLKKNLVNIEKSSQRDMLFEIMMARYDILNEYRTSVKNIINHFMSRPQGVLKLIPKLIESKILIATFANINPSGIQGIIKIKIIFALYYITLFTWFNDENESLEKTMSVLDKYLNNIEKVYKIFMSSQNFINYKEFENVDIRIGTVIEAHEYNELKKPSIILKIDFGEKIGIKKTSAQLQKYYKSDELINKQVIAVVNFEPKQIGKIISEVLVLGVPDLENEPVLLSPDKPVNNGGKLF